MRSTLAPLLIIAAVSCQLCFAGEPDIGSEPTLYFHGDAADPEFGSVDLQNISVDVITQLRRADLSIVQWQSLFSVFVELADSAPSATPSLEGLPPISGQYQILPDAVRFTPRFAPIEGLRYRATADLSTIRGHSVGADQLTLTFSLSQQVAASSTAVEAVFPSGDTLPENLLRFYVHFSAPMQRGRARDQIALLGPDGQPDAAAFFNAPTELWDPEMKRLAILLDPGRIKREVGPNVELGPPLLSGKKYTLVVGAGMLDATGHPLRGSFTKSFLVAPAIRKAIDPKRWAIGLPVSGTRRPLTFTFPGPLDQALLSREIRIVGIDHNPVAGTDKIDRAETRWAFTPSLPWKSGPYHAEIGASLEDVSGNTVWAPFDIDAHTGEESKIKQKQMTLALQFSRAKRGMPRRRTRTYFTQVRPADFIAPASIR